MWFRVSHGGLMVMQCDDLEANAWRFHLGTNSSSSPHPLADPISRTTIKHHDQVPRCGCRSRSTRWILSPWNLLLFQDVWQTDKISQHSLKKLRSSVFVCEVVLSNGVWFSILGSHVKAKVMWNSGPVDYAGTWHNLPRRLDSISSSSH